MANLELSNAFSAWYIRLGDKCHERSANLGKIADEISDLNTACIASGFTAAYLISSMVPWVLGPPSKHAESSGDATAKAADAAEDDLWEVQAGVPLLCNTPKKQYQLYIRMQVSSWKVVIGMRVFAHNVHALISLHISKELNHYFCPPISLKW